MGVPLNQLLVYLHLWNPPHLTCEQVEVFENETLGPSLGPRHRAPKPPVTDRKLALMARARSHRLNRSKRCWPLVQLVDLPPRIPM